MSASIYYQAVSGTRLSIGGPSSFLQLMRRVFGDAPWTFTERDTSRLETAAAAVGDEEQRAALTELAGAVMKHGEIRVWAEY